MPTSDSPTPRLHLIVPVDSDNFRTTDFQTNWENIEAHPGIAPVSTLPGSGWDGQVVLLTTNHLAYVWSTTTNSWVSPTLPTVWHFEADPGATLGGSGSPYTSASRNFTVPTLCSIMVLTSVDIHIDDVSGASNDFFGDVLIDGTSQSSTHIANQVGSTNAGGETTFTVTGFNVFTATAGTHTFQFRGYRGTTGGGSEAVTLANYRVNLLAVQKGSGSQ